MERRAATHDEARALSNPLRLRILRLCLDRAMTNPKSTLKADTAFIDSVAVTDASSVRINLKSPGGSLPALLSDRLGIRLTAEQREAFQARIDALAQDLKDADDPAGEPYGFFAGMHRRAE